MANFLDKSFPFLMLASSALAFFVPEIFTSLKPSITYMLGAVMLFMGLSLDLDDFKLVFKHPKGVFLGVGLQFLIMPFVGFLLAKFLNLPLEIAVGVILVGCCPGGIASNVLSYLAKANVALSVACTSISTLLSPILTPLIFYILASSWIEIDFLAMMSSVTKIVLAPVLVGIILNKFFRNLVTKFKPFTPGISMVIIILIISIIIAINKPNLSQNLILVLVAVVLHNGFGLAISYFLARFLGLSHYDAKAVCLEVGVQNSGLGASLASSYFSPLSAIPSVIFSIWHNISGSILANIFSKKS